LKQSGALPILGFQFQYVGTALKSGQKSHEIIHIIMFILEIRWINNGLVIDQYGLWLVVIQDLWIQ